MAIKIHRTTFEPGDDQQFDAEGKPIPDTSPGLQSAINGALDQARKEAYETAVKEVQGSKRFKRWAEEKLKRTPSGRAGEQHFTPKELAILWNVSEQTIRNIFANDSDVLRYGNSQSTRSKRKYQSMTIPQSVVDRVRKRLAAVPKAAK